MVHIRLMFKIIVIIESCPSHCDMEPVEKEKYVEAWKEFSQNLVFKVNSDLWRHVRTTYSGL